MRYKQLDIYAALGIMGTAAPMPPSTPEVPEFVGGTHVGRGNTQNVDDTDAILFYVTKLPANCYKCPCSRAWETKEGRKVACRISGKSDLAEKAGRHERRKDCPLRILSDAAGGQGGQLR